MTPGVRAAFHGLPVGARILDAACGIGFDAIALDRRGFAVTGVDASQAMLDEARRRFGEDGREIETRCSTWADLADHFPAGSFDAVLCTGNSIAHLATPTEMVESFRAFAAVLGPGGVVILDTHHWEVLARLGDRTTVDPQVIERDGARCVRTYAWRRVGAGGPWRLTIGLEIGRGLEHETLRRTVELHPFSTAALNDRLRSAGFTHVSIDATPEEDRYTAIGRVGAAPTRS